MLRGIKLVFFVGLLVGIVFGLMAQSTSAEDQVLRIAVATTDISDLHPHIGVAKGDRGIIHTMFNGLVRYKPGDMAAPFEPDLAESWEASPDKKGWTFHLRRGVMVHPWDDHPAYELTSEDVVYSFQSAADPAQSAFAAEYAGMTFEAVDRYTVKISLDQPLSEVLMLPKVADYAGGLIMSKKAAEDLGKDYHTRPVGTGPFMFKEYKPKEKYVVVRNEDYFRGVPKLAGVEFRFMPDESSRKFGLQSQELDAIVGATQPFVKEMEAVPGVIVDTYGPGHVIMLYINMTKEPFDDIRVRRAVLYSLNRDEARATVGLDLTEKVYVLVPPLVSGGLTREELEERGRQDGKDYVYETDRNKAKELLTEAGFPNGFSTEMYITEREDYQVYMPNIQFQLRKSGIDLKLRTVEHSTYHSYIRKDMNPIVAYNAWRPDANVFLTHFYYSHSIVVTGASPNINFSHIGGVDADGDGTINSVDNLIEAARRELDPGKQADFWKKAQIKARDWAVSWPGFLKKFVIARNSYLDWGYDLKSSIQGFPIIDELTTISK